MSVPSGSLRPHETGLREPSARDSVVPVRYVPDGMGGVRLEAFPQWATAAAQMVVDPPRATT